MEGMLAALEASEVARAIRGSRVLYPLVNGTHILGIGMLYGAVAVFDIAVLRGRNQAGHETTTLPIARIGFVLAIATGALLFVCRATHYMQNDAFLLKLSLIGAGAVNVAVFHQVAKTRLAMQRVCAAISLTGWTAAIFAGRWIGFL